MTVLRRKPVVDLSEPRSLFTPAEAAQALRRSTRTIRRLLATGALRAVRIAGGRPLILRSEIERVVRESIDV